MTDTPDDLLARVRAVSRRTFMSNGPDDRRAVMAFAELDALLSSGGPLPAAWADSTPVINVVSHIPDIVDLPDGDQVFAPPPRTVPVAAMASLRRKLADKDAEIHRLTAELDQMRAVPVEYVTESGLAAAMAADPHREDGCVIRTTDGQRRAWAWRAATREWEQVQ